MLRNSCNQESENGWRNRVLCAVSRHHDPLKSQDVFSHRCNNCVCSNGVSMRRFSDRKQYCGRDVNVG